MTPKQMFKKHGVEQLTAIAKSAGTSFVNFRHIALYEGSVSPRLAQRLSKASNNEMKLEEILFQSDHDEQRSQANG